MLYDLNDDYKSIPVILDDIQYEFGGINDIQGIVKKINNIDTKNNLKRQWLPIAKSILAPFNDTEAITIEKDEQLSRFVIFIMERIQNASNK